MGLRDWFRRRPTVALAAPAEVWERLGRLEGEVERLKRLELSWSDYRDQLNRLANRLEKRDQRAARAAAAAPDSEPNDELPWEVRAARIHRSKNGS